MFLPHDGKRKKAVVKQTHSRAYEAAALISRAAVSFRLSQSNDDLTPCKSTAAHRRIAAVSIFAFFHSTHDLHQLKKACSQQRSNAVRSMHYTM